MKSLKTWISGMAGIGLLFGLNTANAGVLEMGLHTGGDELVKVVYVNGDTASIEAGGLISFAAGPSFEFTPFLEARVTVGIKVDDVTASNGDVSFTRYPIDVLVHYKADNWRIGGGITYHLNPTLDGGGVASGLSADFDDALGFLVSVEHDFGPLYLGGRLTFIDYKTIPSSTVNSATVNGNSIGIVGGIRF